MFKVERRGKTTLVEAKACLDRRAGDEIGLCSDRAYERASAGFGNTRGHALSLRIESKRRPGFGYRMPPRKTSATKTPPTVLHKPMSSQIIVSIRMSKQS